MDTLQLGRGDNRFTDAVLTGNDRRVPGEVDSTMPLVEFFKPKHRH